MPEGDTIYRAALTLRRALLGSIVEAAEAPSAKPIGRWPMRRLVGTTVTAVDSRGKHLIVRFSNGLALHTHMQMAGSWHVYRPGDRWRLPRHLARVLLRSAEIEAVCFRAPVVELLSPAQEERHRGLSGLGPDLLADGFDPLQARDNLRALVDHEIGAALLDQRALAGLGNVYRSEVLFVSRQSPFAKVEELSDADIDRLIEQARRLLRANVVGSHKARVTTGIARRGAELWVYDRAGRPCRRCGAFILSDRLDGRVVYWCPRCQA